MTRSIRFLYAVILLFSPGIDAMTETGNKIEKYFWLLLPDKPNKAPVIDPEIAIEFNWPTDSVQLDASVVDDPNDALVYEWTLLSGPGDVTFSNPDAEDTTAEFSVSGIYLLQLSVSDGEFTPEPVQVTVVFNFLENYTNPQQQKLPANRVYPVGQKMMITAWLANSAADMLQMKEHGFTMQGPVWNTIDLSYLDTAIAKELRSAHRIIDGPTNAHELNAVYANGTEDVMYGNLRNRVKLITENSGYNANVDIWLTGVEELSTHIGAGDWEVTLAVATDYLTRLSQIIQEEDPLGRPLWMSDVTGVDASQMNITHRYLDMVGPQMYLERIDPNGDGYKNNAIINELVGEVVKTAETYNIPATVSFGALYEPVPERDTTEFIDRVVEHDLYLALNSGIQGFQIYSWYNYTCVGCSDLTTFNNYKDAYYKHIKRFTEYGLDSAYLWGDKRDDVRLKIVSGPDRIQWVQGDKSYDFPTISMQNIQYGDERFVILTNSSTEVVQVEVSNFPKSCVKALDIREGSYLNNIAPISSVLQPLDVRLYRVEPLDSC